MHIRLLYAFNEYFDFDFDFVSCVEYTVRQVAVRKALVCIGDSIFRGQPPVITWFRIVALFAVSAAVTKELVVNGNAHLVPVVVTTFTELVDRYLAVWIYRQGGWVGTITFARLNIAASL